uniref:ZP domain-containing protein n=1 Tax=Globodera pallida TaxID=36090 RepID=A0A183C956_GLOPA
MSEPEIECGPGIVRFNVKTRQGNASAVYVRGQSQNEDCTFHNTRNITIELAKCNVRRKREVNPNPGIAYQMTVVVQLHPLFVTRVDRAYNVNCFYREQRQDVSVDFGVNELVTQQVMSHAIIPNCTYSVHRDSPNGPRVKYTHVGEQLYHVWSCPSNMYAMLLYNCNAVDGKGEEYPIVDSNGCSRDEFLMPQITYTEDRTRAMAASSAFNFPDRNTMLFTCKIKLCMLKDAECTNLTPPSCNGKRAKSAANGNFNVDNAGAMVGTGIGTRGEGTPAKETETTATTAATSKAQTGGRAGRTEVSGEVDESSKFVESSTSSSTTTTTTTPKTTTTTTTANVLEEETTTRTTTTPLTPTPTSAQTTTTVTPTTPSTTTSSTTTTPATTDEQLLSSVERAASSESIEGTSAAQPKTSSSPSPSTSSSSASSSSSVGLQTETSSTGGVTIQHKGDEKQREMPEDFPRPELLLQNDHSKTEAAAEAAAKKRMERMGLKGEEAEEGSWTISASEEEEKGKQKKHIPQGEEDEFRGVTKPVQIFKKTKSEGTGDEGKPQMTGRTQRDTPAASRAGGSRRRMAEVDFDIQSPELMILDDYEPAAAAQKGSSQRSSVQEVPSFVDWEGGQRAASGRGVCFSPTALICAGFLLLVMIIVVMVALLKLTRKGSAGSAVLEHSFYSQ